MIKFDTFKHENISSSVLEEIIRIKMTAWPYDFKSQTDWINLHFTPLDLHVLLKLRQEYVGYLSIMNRKIFVDGVSQNIFGVGSVCTSIKGQGIGTTLINLTNTFIKENNKIGLLFCNKDLLYFYEKNNWTIIPSSKIQYDCLENKDGIYTLMHNFEPSFNRLSIKGEIF